LSGIGLIKLVKINKSAQSYNSLILEHLLLELWSMKKNIQNVFQKWNFFFKVEKNRILIRTFKHDYPLSINWFLSMEGFAWREKRVGE